MCAARRRNTLLRFGRVLGTVLIALAIFFFYSAWYIYSHRIGKIITTTTVIEEIIEEVEVIEDTEVIEQTETTATFSYPSGSSAQCTAVSCSASVLSSNYAFAEKEVSKSGNCATGRFVIKRYYLGIAVETLEKTLTIICDKNGNIS